MTDYHAGTYTCKKLGIFFILFFNSPVNQIGCIWATRHLEMHNSSQKLFHMPLAWNFRYSSRSSMFKHWRFSLIWFPMPPKKVHIPTTTKKGVICTPQCHIWPILFTEADPYPYSLQRPTHTHTLYTDQPIPILFTQTDPYPYSFQRPTYTHTLYRDWSILFRGRSTLFTEADPYSLQTPKYELPYMKRMGPKWPTTADCVA